MEKNKEQFKIPKCPECGSSNIMTSKTGERFCRRCGNKWQKDSNS